MIKRVLVVGGGVVGITAAYFKSQQGYKVTLVEASNEIGGLLKSETTEFGSFDYGVHIASETGYSELDYFLFGDADQNLYEFNTQHSGSFFHNQLTSFSPFINLNSLNEPQVKSAGYELVKAPQLTQFDNLGDRLESVYGSTAYQYAFFPFVKQTFGIQPRELPDYYINFFDMYRVVAFDETTTSALKNIDYMNDKLGFQKTMKGAKKYYPKEGGIGNWTAGLFEKIVAAGVDVLLNTTVTAIDYKESSISVTYDGLKSNVDELIWAVPSALLPRYLPLEGRVGKPVFRKTALFDFVYQQPVLTSCKYINNFSPNHLSTRLTCYQNLLPSSKHYAITVEVLIDHIENEEQLLKLVSKELSEMGLIEKSNACIFSQYRPIAEGFPVITKENDKKIKQLNLEISTKYPKIILLGRSSSKGFFMSELLVDAYLSCQN